LLLCPGFEPLGKESGDKGGVVTQEEERFA
jgi:hypothetical protein